MPHTPFDRPQIGVAPPPAVSTASSINDAASQQAGAFSSAPNPAIARAFQQNASRFERPEGLGASFAAQNTDFDQGLPSRFARTALR